MSNNSSFFVAGKWSLIINVDLICKGKTPSPFLAISIQRAGYFWRVLKKCWQQKTLVGFTVGEGFAWLVFSVSWLLLRGFLFAVVGVFRDSSFITIDQFVQINGAVIVVRSLCIVPVWWLFFRHWKGKSIVFKIVAHIGMATLYTVAVNLLLEPIQQQVFGVGFSADSFIANLYPTFASYTLSFSIFHVYNFWRDRNEKLKTSQQLRERVYRSQLKTLKAQIEPRFLFQSLQVIGASVPGNLVQTKRLVDQLASTFAYALRVSERKWVELSEELAFVRTWLALEERRFSNRLRVIFDVDPGLENTQVPPFILQPLVENAIKHGIAPARTGGIITVQCKRLDGQVRVRISDTGVGSKHYSLDGTEKGGIGLRNTNKRLLHYYKCGLVIEPVDAGFSIYFDIPLFSENLTLASRTVSPGTLLS